MPESDDVLDADDNPTIAAIREDREKAVAEAQAAKRELAVHRAAPGLSERQARALVADSDLDISDAEAVKAAAAELGYTSTPETPEGPSSEDVAAVTAITEGTAGTTAPDSSKLTAAEVAQWSPEKIAELSPEEFDRVVQEPASGVTA